MATTPAEASPSTPSVSPQGVSLHDLSVGQLAVILAMDEESHAMMIRLKTMGMHDGRALRKVRGGSRVIVNCGGTRIGMTAEVARHIIVAPLTDETNNLQTISE